jgi:energy-coupling factor transport system permease protein
LFVIDKFIGYAFVVAFLALVVYISQIPPRYLYKGLKPVFFLIIFTAVLNIFMLRGGDLIFQLGFIKIYEEGIRTAIFMAARLVLLIMGTSVLTLTTSPIELTDGIEKLLNPFRKVGLPVHELAMMMTIALRFIPTLLDETDKIMKAQMSRGADFESNNIINRAKNLVPLLIPLFISAFRRADELAMAMEARCYRGGYNRTKMRESKLSRVDYIAYLIQIIYLGIILFTRFA